jgi:hypothetical protein
MFTTSTLLIGEGKEDIALVRKMIDERLIPDMDVVPIGDEDHGGGIGGLQRRLEGLPGTPGFVRLRHLGILADNDQDPDVFEIIRAHIRSANAHADLGGKISDPDSPHSTVTNSIISCRVILLPGPGRHGCLETLLFEVLRAENADKMACIEDLVRCTGISGDPNAWRLSKLDKARVRAAIAVLYRRNPALALSSCMVQLPGSHSGPPPVV